MNRKYNIRLDLQFRCNNSTMKFNQFDNNTSDFFIRINNGGKPFDIEKALIVLATIKPSGKVESQFVEVENGLVYADLKPNMKDEIGTYTAKAMLILKDERVVTDAISYEVTEDKIFSLLNDTVEATEEFTMLTDMLSRLSTIEISEEQRVINEAERILAEENRKIEEIKRVEAELIRRHEEADRSKYDATRESNENIRKQNESIRLSNETNRIDEEAKRVEEENKRKLAEEERNANYNFMTEDEERRRLEANSHKEAETLRVQSETNRANEEAKRRTTEQARVSAENTRVSNENTRKTNEDVRQNNETQRVEAETQRKNRYNSFIAEAENVVNNFENYTNNAKVKEEERKANELDRKSQEDRRASNEVERISNENIRKASEVTRENNESDRQNIFTNKVSEVDKKITEMNTIKDNFISSINTKVDNKISEINTTKKDVTDTVDNKVKEIENRFNNLTSSQQQSSEVIDARDNEVSLKARLDRDIEKAKQVYTNVEGSNISTDSSVGYLKDVEIKGNTIQDIENLADIRSVGDKVEGQELYEIPVLLRGKNLNKSQEFGRGINQDGTYNPIGGNNVTEYCSVDENRTYVTSIDGVSRSTNQFYYNKDKELISKSLNPSTTFTTPTGTYYTRHTFGSSQEGMLQLEEGTQATAYEPYQEDKLTILSPVQLEKVGDVADRIIEKDGVLGVEKNVFDFDLKDINFNQSTETSDPCIFGDALSDIPNLKLAPVICDKLIFRDDSIRDVPHIDTWATSAGTRVKLILPNGTNVSEYKNTVKVKGVANTAQFIPLPHSQQVKLRTFANKTNISFLCDVEGTIKAQVPKSLGATVNTHTEQISNLNKELDRVKKLEESTVSTVETESDFTTVEQTSSGYFEDVKLEGKTLVNVGNSKLKLNYNSQGNALFEGDNIKLQNAGVGANAYIENCVFKPSTLYTLIVNCIDTTLSTKHFQISNWNTVIDTTINTQITKGINTYTFITSSNVDTQRFMISVSGSSNQNEYVLIDKITILEGDHTQNPPSGYIEGLASVGDGVDEIVVSSVKGDGNLFNSDFWESGFISDSTGNYSTNIEYVRTKKIRVLPNTLYIFKGYTRRIYYYDTNGNFISRFDIGGGAFSEQTNPFTTPSNCAYVALRYDLKNSASIITSLDMMKQYDTVICKNTLKDGLVHQSDKKRLLYYDEETQTWEKPVLREWDSIEKHSDGKYYYHKRSGQVVLDGSENVNLHSTSNNTCSFTAIISDIYANTNNGTVIDVVCDKFVPTSRNDNFYADVEGISNAYLSSTDNTKNGLFIRIAKSKLSTQDVEGFKQWLQDNNVTVVYQLAEEKVYECTNIDLITYANETNYIVESGVLSPKSTLKVHNNISNVVSLLQKKVSLLESNITSYMITQNRLQLSSTYSADSVTFKVDYSVCSENRSQENYDTDLYNLILNNILVGKDNYDYDHMFNIIMDYASWSQISWEQFDILVGIMDLQHNPPIEPPIEEVPSETPEE